MVAQKVDVQVQVLLYGQAHCFDIRHTGRYRHITPDIVFVHDYKEEVYLSVGLGGRKKIGQIGLGILLRVPDSNYRYFG